MSADRVQEVAVVRDNDDCISEVVKNAKTELSVQLGVQNCKNKFSGNEKKIKECSVTWNGSAFVTWYTTSSSQIGQQCVDSISFPTITTTQIRITDVKMVTTGQNSNPNWREIQIISGASVNNDADALESLNELEKILSSSEIEHALFQKQNWLSMHPIAKRNIYGS